MRRQPLPPGFWRDPLHVLAFGLGAGAAPLAPGTFGTLAAVPLYLLLAPLATPVYLLVVLVLALAGVFLCGYTARRLGVHDHPGIVWDEIVGYLLTMSFAPRQALWMVAGFLLFRLFDIWKPFPIRRVDSRVRGGLGIMLDDLLAAVYAAAVMQGLVWAAGRYAPALTG